MRSRGVASYIHRYKRGVPRRRFEAFSKWTPPALFKAYCLQSRLTRQQRLDARLRRDGAGQDSRLCRILVGCGEWFETWLCFGSLRRIESVGTETRWNFSIVTTFGHCSTRSSNEFLNANLYLSVGGRRRSAADLRAKNGAANSKDFVLESLPLNVFLWGRLAVRVHNGSCLTKDRIRNL